MKVYMVAFLLLGISFSSKSHDFNMSIFRIYVENNEYKTSIRFDREDLVKCIYDNYSKEEIVGSDFHNLIKDYILSRVSMTFDGEWVELSIDKLESDEQYYEATGKISPFVQNVQKIWIQNSCMIESIEGHSNIVKVDLHDRKRSFRLNLNRQRTTIVY